MKQVYLDFAAATPMRDEVVDAMGPFFKESFYNPSSLYQRSKQVKDDLEKARTRVAQTIGCRPSEVIFTAGGTESDNLAINGVMEKHPGKNLIVSAVEHEAVRQPAEIYKCKISPVDKTGEVKLDKLEQLIDKDTVLISCIYANNEVGTVQPVKEISNIIKKVRNSRRISGMKTPLYLHIDAAQAPLYLDINVARLGVDLMSLNGGKIYGPKQSGILYAKATIELNPQITGGGQERGMRSGTENVANIAGFAKALELAADKRKVVNKNTKFLSDYFKNELKTSFQAIVNGSSKKNIPNIIHATFEGQDNERLLFSLDELGVMAATGSACSASKERFSHVLRAMGVSEKSGRSSLRFSLGCETTKEDIDYALSALAKILN